VHRHSGQAEPAYCLEGLISWNGNHSVGVSPAAGLAIGIASGGTGRTRLGGPQRRAPHGDAHDLGRTTMAGLHASVVVAFHQSRTADTRERWFIRSRTGLSLMHVESEPAPNRTNAKPAG